MSQAHPDDPRAGNQSSRDQRLSMTGLIFGGVLVGLALLTLALLLALFVLGGGGDTERFSTVARNFLTVSLTLGTVGLAALLFGIITRSRAKPDHST